MKVPVRPQQGRVLGGVCVGLAETYALDATLLRLAFLALAFAWGVGVVLYCVAWLGMPSAVLERPARIRSQNWRNWSAGSAATASELRQFFSSLWKRVQQNSVWQQPHRRGIAVVMIAAGGLVVLTSAGVFNWVTPVRALGLAAVVLGISLLKQSGSK